MVASCVLVVMMLGWVGDVTSAVPLMPPSRPRQFDSLDEYLRYMGELQAYMTAVRRAR